MFAVLVRDRASRVVAVEPDLRKVRRIDGIGFVAGYDDVIRGHFDVVTIMPTDPSLRLTTARSTLTFSSAPKPSRTVSSLLAAAILPRPTNMPSR